MDDLSAPVVFDGDMMLKAFPSIIHSEARRATNQLSSMTRRSYCSRRFPLMVLGEQILIPQRLHFFGYASPLQSGSIGSFVKSCLRTRSLDGFERQKALRRVLPINEPWSIPFVIALVGEYVVDILAEILGRMREIDAGVVRRFLLENPDFHRKTRQRVASYWDAYYRHIPRDEYVGFRLIALMDAVVSDENSPLNDC